MQNDINIRHWEGEQELIIDKLECHLKAFRLCSVVNGEPLKNLLRRGIFG